MENKKKVFSSNIIRTNNNLKNNLYEILNIDPVQPLSENTNKNNNCAFVPKNDKYYVPKKKIGQKVKTVREIRNSFESDIFLYLPAELQKQKNYLLRKIRFGSAKNENTKTLAKNMLKDDTPMLRSVWQMLMNINPEEHNFSSQYILWNGKYIQVNGSRGGKRQFICNYDVGKINKSSYKKSIKNKISNRKKYLLQCSLDVKFKPGPLSKKKKLDTSYQKYQFGGLEVVNLPKPGLDVQTCYHKPLAPAIDTFLQSACLQNKDGYISQKWADFATSVVGQNKNGSAVQIDANSCVTFDINYKCYQNRLLTRRESDYGNMAISETTSDNVALLEEESIIESTVRTIMDKLLDSVDISVNQGKMYNGEDEPREIATENGTSICINSSNKNKRKFGELDRLDVTIITISDKTNCEKTKLCLNDYCTLGCICDSLQCSYNLKRHCGRVECMFKCKCNFSKYKLSDCFSNDCADIIPGLIKLDKKLGQTLTKEEHKFHQTVIVTDKKRILLKPERRNWKTSKKYADFYSNMCLRPETSTKQMLSIVCPKINCENIEPWCMVHNLYRCFCKGHFTETGHTVDDLKILENENNDPKLSTSTNTTNTQNLSDKNNQCIGHIELLNEKQVYYDKSSLQTRSRQDLRSNESAKKNVLCTRKQPNTNISSDNISNNDTCARTEPYNGRKYSDGHYLYTNRKIFQMEKNDKTLHKRIVSLIQKDTNENCNNQPEISDLSQQPSTLKEMLYNVVREGTDNSEKKSYENSDLYTNQRPTRLRNHSTLVTWLESSYKLYKERISQGLVKTSLDPPIPGKLALYPWDFILNRYKEHKNHFLVSEKKPYRIFISVDTKSPFFNNCINISDIILHELDKYPATVQNLLTNVTIVNDSFCVLYGLSQSWEIIGSVTKIIDTKERDNSIDQLLMQDDQTMRLSYEDDNGNFDPLPISVEKDIIPEKNKNQEKDTNQEKDKNQEKDTNQEKDKSQHKVHNRNTETSNLFSVSPEIPISKWFVMTVENDFTEIQFYNKGFFVEYESVIKAIDIARESGKTVRLSSKKCNDQQKDPYFGIYAIPSNERCCVFIGPYNKDEALGIETLKSMHNIKASKRTRGMWITTNEVDNLKVIDNPSLFMPSLDVENHKMVTLESDRMHNANNIKISSNDQVNNVSQQKVPTERSTKYVKPIKIRKTNGFYHLAPNGLLKQILSPEKDANKSLLTKSNATVPMLNLPLVKPVIVFDKNSESTSNLSVKPVAEIAPYSKEFESKIEPHTPRKGGMFVLKPAEINERSLQNQLHDQKHLEHLEVVQQPENISVNNIDDIPMDIENFLTTPVVPNLPDSDIYVISDEEDEVCKDSKKNSFKNVWIVSKNIENIGWIPGRKNNENKLSFEFPGFRYSEFYPEQEALSKVSQVMARKIYVPKHIELEWNVIESEAEIKAIKKLESKDLEIGNVLTKNGIRCKLLINERLKHLKNLKGSKSKKATKKNVSKRRNRC